MNKELTALETWYLVKKYLNIYHHQAIKENIDVETVEGYPIDIIETALKALEIIKSKKVNVRALLKSTYSFLNGLSIYNSQCYNRQEMESKELTPEEYELLKEVLK